MKRIVLLLAMVAVAPLYARDLSWPLMHVESQLDGDGRLHVVERLRFRFDGDWNGGERTFVERGRQTFTLERLTRVAQNGQAIDLKPGDLTHVDDYKWTSEHVLRWRSRLPSDVPFDHTEIEYEIQYTLGNILTPAPGAERTWRLDHDFAFPKREGVIERFELLLNLAPEWSPVGTFERQYQAGPLSPGQGFLVTTDLAFHGARSPGAVITSRSIRLRRAASFIPLFAVFVLFVLFLVGEKRLGRFQPLPAINVDESWLNENIFSSPPEVVGALWDGKIGPPEVAATLARMTQEGKLRSNVVKGGILSKPALELDLLVPRDTLAPHERLLVGALFFNGEHTSTEAVRAHYTNGFDPAEKIRKPLEAMIDSSRAWRATKRPPILKREAVIFAIAFLLLISNFFLGTDARASAMTTLFASIFVLVFGTVIAYSFSRDLTAVLPKVLFTAVLPAALALMGFVLASMSIGMYSYITAALFIILVSRFIFLIARCPENAARMEMRRRLIVARRYFIRELRRKNPALQDDWYPYLLAFGLGSNVDRWFRSYGHATADSYQHSDSSWNPSSSTGGEFGAGGGSFGGAGASASWAAAAGALAAGVASPGSSDGGGGGDSGGSSGGGGGGGW
ncbi:MAG: DUF2207 domain-containing protein [Acidobacteriota bacterium]